MIYVLFSCDANKTYGSMRVLGASTNLNVIKNELKSLLKAEEVEFNQEKFDSKDNWRVYDLNSSFEYAHIEELEDGEFI